MLSSLANLGGNEIKGEWRKLAFVKTILVKDFVIRYLSLLAYKRLEINSGFNLSKLYISQSPINDQELILDGDKSDHHHI